jgi:hypothetical protein
MNGPDHYRVAERLLEEAVSREEPDSRALWCLELAKVHTALAQVAATALNCDGREMGRGCRSQVQHDGVRLARVEIYPPSEASPGSYPWSRREQQRDISWYGGTGEILT